MSKKNQYAITLGEDEAGDNRFDVLVEFEVTEKFGSNRTYRSHEILGRDPDHWDDEASTGNRINRNKVNGY